jgi:predicted small secreted protein
MRKPLDLETIANTGDIYHHARAGDLDANQPSGRPGPAPGIGSAREVLNISMKYIVIFQIATICECIAGDDNTALPATPPFSTSIVRQSVQMCLTPDMPACGARLVATKEFPMRKFSLMTAITVTAMLLLSACNTTSGVGKDLSKAGGAITNSADKHSY